MNEQDYINATNLAKLRIATDIVRDLYYDGNTQNDKACKTIVAMLVRMRREAEKVVEDNGDAD